jgi:hypothetical protein
VGPGFLIRSSEFLPSGASAAERDNDPDFQIAEKIALNVEKERYSRTGLRIGISADSKLGHQKVRKPVLKTPFFLTSSL